MLPRRPIVGSVRREGTVVGEGGVDQRPVRWRTRWRPTGLRTRLVATFGLALLLTLAGSTFAARTALLARLDERISAELDQEFAEFRALAVGVDPETGQPLDEDLERLFTLFLERNVPAEHEVNLTYLDGRPFARSRQVVPFLIDEDPELTRRFTDLATRERGAVETPAGRLEYLAVPLEVPDPRDGVFVAANFRDLERDEVDEALRALGGIGATILIAGCVLAAVLADRILRPVGRATSVARHLSETDLSRRLPVTGRDELSELSATLNQMLARLERAFETQRRFLEDVGHELRTPLTIVRGHLEQLEDDPEERRESLRLVLDEHERMGRLIGDLLTLARAQRPDFLAVEVVGLDELTDDLLAKAMALGDRRWSLAQRAEGDVVCDAQRITQAVLQLAENAVQHTRAGDAIAIGSARDGPRWRVWVQDTGPGIAAEDQGALFDRFASGRIETGGTGLGLSIVRAIAAAHGGRVELVSAVGEGATFELRLPVDGPRV